MADTKVGSVNSRDNAKPAQESKPVKRRDDDDDQKKRDEAEQQVDQKREQDRSENGQSTIAVA